MKWWKQDVLLQGKYCRLFYSVPRLSGKKSNDIIVLFHDSDLIMIIQRQLLPTNLPPAVYKGNEKEQHWEEKREKAKKTDVRKSWKRRKNEGDYRR